MPDHLTLVLVDRPSARPALVALAGAIEASPVADRVHLALARGPAAVVAAAAEAGHRGAAVAIAWSFFSAEVSAVAAELALVRHSLAAPVLQIAGGVHASADPAGTLALGFDLVGRGEGEATIIGLAERMLAGADPRSVPGLAWLTGSGVASSGRTAAVDLDAHPASSRRLGKALALEVTRGCIWACRFCQTPFLHRARFRHRSIASARAWARHAVELGHRDLRFLSPSALSYGAQGGEARLDAVEELLAAVRAEAGASRRIFFGTFPSELRPEHVTPQALAVIGRWADNREILVGAQSGSDRLLAEMGRGHGTADILRAPRLARDAGFTVSIDFIVGLPGETPADLEATRSLMERVVEDGARVHAHAFLPLPGTPWAGEAPGRVDEPTRLLLDRLASRGRAYGHWRSQVTLGARLARSAGPLR